MAHNCTDEETEEEVEEEHQTSVTKYSGRRSSQRVIAQQGKLLYEYSSAKHFAFDRSKNKQKRQRAAITEQSN